MERGADGPLDRAEHRPFVAEAHLRLRGVHIHVDTVWRDRDEDERDRVAAARNRPLVRLLDGVRQRAARYRPAVDDEDDAAA